MDIDVQRPGAHVALSGRLGSASVGDARIVLSAAIDAGIEDLLLDLGGVELVDATGLGLLVGMHRRAERLGRRLVLTNVPERMERLILATRLHRVLILDRSSGDVTEAAS